MWQPVILLIAFTGKKSNSENGLPKLRRGAAMTMLRNAAIVVLTLVAACSQQPVAKDLVWPSDQEVFGIEPGGTIRATGMKQLMDKCRALQSGELPSDPEEDKSCVSLHTLLMDVLEDRKSFGHDAGGH